jgi:hypothetical protein
MANTTIQVRKSGVTGNVPSSLNFGELALNYADGKLYYKNASGTITYISSGSGANSFATINANSSLILATSNTDTLSIAPGNNITVAANTVSKTIIVGLTNDVTVANSLIVGSGSGGNITGANTISANTVIANTVNVRTTLVFSDGTTQTTAAGGAATDLLARTVANAAFASANNIGNIANGAFTQANTAQSTASGAASSASTAQTTATNAQTSATNANNLAQAAFNKANTGGSTAFSTFIDPSGNTVSATANTSLKFVAGSGIQINVSNTNPTSLAISSLPGQQGLTVDWGFVSDPLYAYYDFGSSMVL